MLGLDADNLADGRRPQVENRCRIAYLYAWYDTIRVQKCQQLEH